MRASKHVLNKGSVPPDYNTPALQRTIDTRKGYAALQRRADDRNKRARFVVVVVLPLVLCTIVAIQW